MHKPCTSGDCEKRAPADAQALVTHRLPHHKFSTSTSPSMPASRRVDERIIHCMLCDTSGHAHGTVRLIFEPQGPLPYRQGQLLRVLLPGSCGLEILITSHPSHAGVMHGRLLVPRGESLPAQFGPEASFGLMFQVCAPPKARSS